MFKISEANLSQAMKFTFEEFIENKNLDPDHILAYSPKSQGDKKYLRDNPTTGLIYLKKHPNAREAWVLVKFGSREATYGQTTIPQTRKTIRTEQEFQDYFGVTPVKGFTDDTRIMVTSDYQKVTDKNPKRDFDETTPDFYMYTNHLKVNLDKLIKRLYRINDIIEKTGTIDGLFNIPYSATDI